GIAAALDDYESDNGKYPTTSQGLVALSVKPAQEPLPQNWQGPYLKKKTVKDPWGRDYIYRSPGAHRPQSYDLYSLGADGKEGGEGSDRDIVNWE
ncbi:MAG: type II secretion system major pseudopilin GspG, partial [Spirochaetia bacterium]|nr:type II secretion system major pseudopilin GspG [Spirochaetia bacterium]